MRKSKIWNIVPNTMLEYARPLGRCGILIKIYGKNIK